MNKSVAAVVATKLASYLLGTNVETKVDVLAGPQQTNGYDCGVYMILAVEMIAREILSSRVQDMEATFRNVVVSEVDVIKKRSLMAYVLNNLTIAANDLSLLMLCHDLTTNPSLVSPNLHVANEWATVKKGIQNKSTANTFCISCSNRFTPLDVTKITPQTIQPHETIDDTHNSNKYTSKKVKTTPEKQKNPYVNTPPNENVAIQNKKRLHVYADSHGKGLGNILESLLPKCFDSFVCANAGAKVEYVLNNAKNMASDFSCDDTVVVIAGANNIGDNTQQDYTPVRDIPNHLINFAAANNKTNIVYVTQLHRYDLKWNSTTNNEIHEINRKLSHTENLNIIDITDFQSNFFTRHGQHLNKLGKQVLCRRIADFVLKCGYNKQRQVTIDYPAIKIIEESMEAVIERNCNDTSVGFAHCISADFDSNKQMSRGVAVAFKNKFGKPQSSDYCGCYLTHQETVHGAHVYSIVSKPKFFLNYNNFSQYRLCYDTGFTEMSLDFKTRNLKTLICSPMGCNRDRLPLVLFVRNLITFARATNASVFIVCGESSSTTFSNGYSHKDFINQLIFTINTEISKHPRDKLTQPDVCNITDSPASATSTDVSPSRAMDQNQESAAVNDNVTDLDDDVESLSLYNTSLQSNSEDSSLVLCVEGGNKVIGGGGGSDVAASGEPESVNNNNNCNDVFLRMSQTSMTNHKPI